MKHIVGFSGGIDSQACALWVRNHFPSDDILLLNTNAGGNEHPLTDAFVQEYSRTVFPVTTIPALFKDLWKTPGFAETRGFDGEEELTFSQMVQVKGRPPSPKAQFCTEILKLRPQRRWVIEHIEDEYERYTGLRRDESQARRHTPLREWDDYFDCYVNHPIAAWSKEEVFAYVRAAGETINPLYSLGFGRVGCAPCINSGKEDITRWSRRFPEMIDRVRQMEADCGRTYFAPCVPGKATNTVDEVVAWAKTDRGGVQFNILQGLPLAACESRFGLCE